MNGTKNERRIVVAIMGYAAWVVSYDISQYSSMITLQNHGLQTFITLATIFLTCITLTIFYIMGIGTHSGKFGLSLGIPWLLICLVCDFALITYFRDWNPNILGYATSRAWYFVLVPVGCIIAGVITPLIWKPKKAIFTPAPSVPKIGR